MFRSTFATLCLCALTSIVHADDFDRLDGKRWEVHLPQWAGVHMHDDELSLQCRPCLFRREPMPPSTAYQLEWAWEKQVEEKAMADALTLLFRTSGEIDKSGQTTDGLRVTLHAGTGVVTIDNAKTGKELAKGTLPAGDVYALPPVGWHKLRVVDMGKSLMVYVGDGQEPITVGSYDPATFKGKLFGITNRAKEGNVRMSSYVRKVVVSVPR